MNGTAFFLPCYSFSIFSNWNAKFWHITKSSFLATRLCKKVIFTKNLVTRFYKSTNEVCKPHWHQTLQTLSTFTVHILIFWITWELINRTWWHFYVYFTHSVHDGLEASGSVWMTLNFVLHKLNFSLLSITDQSEVTSLWVILKRSALVSWKGVRTVFFSICM